MRHWSQSTPVLDPSRLGRGKAIDPAITPDQLTNHTVGQNGSLPFLLEIATWLDMVSVCIVGGVGLTCE